MITVDAYPEKKYEACAREKILELFRDTNARIFLFGSRARGDARRGSDADIGIEGVRDEAFRRLKIRFDEFWEESRIPFHVELVHFDRVDPDFRKQALKDVVVWKVG